MTKPYSFRAIFIKYIRYVFTSQTKHDIHSPFLFEFTTQVLNNKKQFEEYSIPEKIRQEYLLDQQTIEVKDYGAGSTTFTSPHRKIKDIAKYSLKSKKLAQLIFRISKYYHCKNILEIGTSLGVTTSYLSLSSTMATIYSLEGSEEILNIVRKKYRDHQIKNITLIQGDFSNTLPELIKNVSSLDLVFVDGNHSKHATLEYYRIIYPTLHNNSIVIFDDIHWSKDMEEAWDEIKNKPEVKVTVDLFFMGIVFFRKELSKQDFTIYYNGL